LQQEQKLKELEADKRRLERLLSMTRKVLRPGPMKTTLDAHARPRWPRAIRALDEPEVERWRLTDSSSEQNIR